MSILLLIRKCQIINFWYKKCVSCIYKGYKYEGVKQNLKMFSHRGDNGVYSLKLVS